jgi:hypothetical protein
VGIGFISRENTVKMEHLINNPRVALCVDSLQIEGDAVISGHPSLPENRDLLDKYRQPHPSKKFHGPGRCRAD